MEQADGLLFGIGGMAEIEDVAIGTEAGNHATARRSGNGVTLKLDRRFAVIADARAGLLAPDLRAGAVYHVGDKCLQELWIPDVFRRTTFQPFWIEETASERRGHFCGFRGF